MINCKNLKTNKQIGKYAEDPENRARDYWHARQTKSVILPPIRKQLLLYTVDKPVQNPGHARYTNIKHAHNKQCFIDFDSRKAKFQNRCDLITAEDYK